MKQRLILAFNMSGFNPNHKEGLGAGFICGILFVFDLPFALLSIVVNFLFKAHIRSIGVVSFREIYSYKATFAGIMGFILMSVGIGGWFNPSPVMYGMGTLSYQEVWIIIQTCLAIINVTATIYSRRRT